MCQEGNDTTARTEGNMDMNRLALPCMVSPSAHTHWDVQNKAVGSTAGSFLLEASYTGASHAIEAQ